MDKSKSLINLSGILTILTFVALGCLGPGGDSSRCEGAVTADGKTFKGEAKDEEQAAFNACNKFCLETDSEFETMYRIWLTSPKAKELEKKRGRILTKQEAIFEDGKLLDYITLNCAVRCKNYANKGKHTLQTKCK